MLNNKSLFGWLEYLFCLLRFTVVFHTWLFESMPSLISAMVQLHVLTLNFCSLIVDHSLHTSIITCIMFLFSMMAVRFVHFFYLILCQTDVNVIGRPSSIQVEENLNDPFVHDYRYEREPMRAWTIKGMNVLHIYAKLNVIQWKH
jgi:hypothetical protein